MINKIVSNKLLRKKICYQRVWKPPPGRGPKAEHYFAEITKFLYSVNCGFPRPLRLYPTSLIFHSEVWREAASLVVCLHFLDLLLLLMLLYCSRRLWGLPYGLNTMPHSCSYTHVICLTDWTLPRSCSSTLVICLTDWTLCLTAAVIRM